MQSQNFIANLSHEIRNSMNGIVGYTQLLSQTKLDNNQKKYVSSLSTCCVQLVSVINDILDFSRLSSGTSKLNLEIFSLKELEQEIKSILGNQLENKKQKLRFIYDSNLPEYILSDKQKILQVLINLISNANKYSGELQKILVGIKKRDLKIEFMVQDKGIGISEEDQKKLFTPFFQVNSESKGSGLGLAICKKLVEILEGDIRVESDSEGSTFIFTSKYENIENYKNRTEEIKKLLQGKYVLICIEKSEERLILEDLLYELKAITIMSFSAKEVSRLIERKYDFAACIIEKKYIKDIYNLPDNSIIVTENEDVKGTNELGKNVIIKPIHHMKLLDCLYRILKNNIEELNVLTISSSQQKILIAEDVSYNLDMMVKILQSLNYNNIITAADGEETVQKIIKEKPDILLLDLKMPKLTGIDVLKKIKELGYSCKIAVITASANEKDKEECKEYGANYFLIKPININDLKKLMNRLV